MYAATPHELGQQSPPESGYSIERFRSLIDGMDARLATMLRDGDPRAVFQLTYLTFSRQVLKAVEARRFEDERWAIDMCCRFVEVYLDQVEFWEDRHPAQCRAWRVAFESMEDGRLHVLQAMLLGMNAHIHYDLAFTTLGACRALGDLDGAGASERALGGARSGVPTVRYRDFLVINRVGWESIPVIQDAVLGQFNRLLFWGNQLARPLTALFGQRVLMEARDASWCQTTLLMHAQDASERALVARVIDAYAASIADVIRAMTWRPQELVENAVSWLRRAERLDPEVQAGLVEMALRNPVVAELALHQLAFAGAEPVAVLETLLGRGEERLANVFARLALGHGPLGRRERLARYLENGSAPALVVLESMLLAGELPKSLARRVPVQRVVEGWRLEASRMRQFAVTPEVARHEALSKAVVGRARELERRVDAAPVSLPVHAPRKSPKPVSARDVLPNHPDRWIQLCAREAYATDSSHPTGEPMPSIIERVLFLKETPLFLEVDPAVLVHVAESVQTRSFLPGQVLVTAGRANDGVYIVREGQVEVSQARDGGKVPIATLGPRDSIGELSVLNETPATADCTALTTVHAFFLPRQILSNLLHQHPRLAIGMIRMLSERLMATTLRVHSEPAAEGGKAA